MEQTEFDQLLSTAPEDLIKKIKASKLSIPIEDFQKQYDPKQHAVMDTSKRQDTLVTTDTGTEKVNVTRIPIPYQKKIVRLAAAFLCGNPIQLNATPVDDTEINLLKVLQKTWDDNKLDYDSKQMAKIMFSETEVAELWYTEPIEPGYWLGTVNDTPSVKFRLRMKVLANKFGDNLLPIYNAAGDMIAFGRGYFMSDGDKKIEHFDIYTSTTTYKFTKEDTWAVTPEKNLIGKIPVIYYNQDVPEWSDVQEMIERMETSISNHGDTNDYYGSPMVKVTGEIKGFAKKGQRGKVIELENNADAEYMSWDNSPESMKLEYTNLRSLIHEMSDTPDISMEMMKGLGTFSGLALKMLFLGAHLKASDKEEIFGKGIQRRINYLKSALGIINVTLAKAVPMNVKPKFEYYLPKDDKELIDLLATATGGNPTMSQQTAVSKNPLVKDADVEIKLIKDEGAATNIQP
jgi:SPP1 family phage portal protein